MEFYRMHFLTTIIFCIICVPKFSFGRCPNPKTLYPRTSNGKSMCAKVYIHSHYDPNFSCGGRSRDIYNGEYLPWVGSDWNDEISSVVVREGCTLTVYQHRDYKGNREDLTGVHRLKDIDWNDYISSYVCNCDFPPVDCEPSDELALLVSCDNSNYNNEMTCRYAYSKGISIATGQSSTKSQSMTISKSIGAEIGIKFLKASTENSVSFTTGYSWTSSSLFTTTETETTGAHVTVAPGHHVGVYQVQGRCGDNVINTRCIVIKNMRTKKVIKSYPCV